MRTFLQEQFTATINQQDMHSTVQQILPVNCRPIHRPERLVILINHREEFAGIISVYHGRLKKFRIRIH